MIDQSGSEEKNITNKTTAESNKDVHYKKVYRADRTARRFITIGGYGIAASILAILLFLLYQSLPLAQKASLDEMLSFTVHSNAQKVMLTGIDPYLEVFYTLDNLGNVKFYRVASQTVILEKKLPLKNSESILSSARGTLSNTMFAVGTDSGRIMTVEVEMKPRYTEKGRTIEPSMTVEETWSVPRQQDGAIHKITGLAFSQNEDFSRFWSWVDDHGGLFLRIYDADMDEEYLHDLSSKIGDGSVSALTISHNGENLVVGKQNGQALWFNTSDFEEVALENEFQAVADRITALNYLLGDQGIIIGDMNGDVSEWFPVRSLSNIFKFNKIHTFESHPAAISQIVTSPRNRNFLTIDIKGNAKLHYSTSGKTQLSFKPADNPIFSAAIAPKGNGILAIDTQRQFSLFRLNDPHPETTLKTLFGKVWYEGYPQPEFVWQSTGGSDEFEPKLSLIPLIFGTLKGTLYAMLFSIPLAILGAIYVSQFAPKWMSRTVKPTVEIMAALPSVVIGFLAGLYFSTLFEEYLMMIFLFTFWMPVMFGVGILVWILIPEERRIKWPAGLEMLFMLPFGLIALWLSGSLGPGVENWLFAGNFQQWLYSTFNITYETRNSLVVGFALGFAVIPIIFTVADDALSNVPESLTSASLALGASRWQTVRQVVLPAASAGIFAAIMLGLGRAVGETMIVLMATGNTPILDLNPFNGFRAMSANIAVEIPEAPVGGTLYRVLFLTAFLLFIFTFVLNTISSLIGDRLRKKYARF